MIPPTTSDCAARPVIDTASLLVEMVDLGRLSRRACVPHRVIETSSADPRSMTPEPPTSSDDGWFANIDWGHYLAVEQRDGRSEHVMLDTDGPGAIVRLWTANGNGTLRVYLDGNDQPVLAEAFAPLLRGMVAPFGAPFSAETSAGRNLEFPIPFREHAKITVEAPDPGIYWQVTTRLYGPGADVRSFARDDLDAALMSSVAAQLTGGCPAPSDGIVVAAAASRRAELELTAAAGGSEIVELVVTPASRDARTLRETVLAMVFDGRETVRVPLGDFFGLGPGFHPHRTFLLEVTDDGEFIGRLVMPFASRVTIAVESPMGQRAALRLRHRAAPFTDGSYHFHARWESRAAVPTRPFRDLTVADLRGEGNYVGTQLAVDSRSDEWWGEGDEKVWVDDDTFPSWFGTGTEDYFGYAYSTRNAFDHPYRTLRPTGDARGQVAQARFHVLDAIPFQTALRFELELWHWDVATTVGFDTLAYVYMRPD